MMGKAALLSAAVLIAPGCQQGPAPKRSSDEPVRRAGFRSLAARDFVLSCPQSAGRAELASQVARHEELKHLAAQSGAGEAVAGGENEWAGLSRYSQREPCTAGDEAFRQALAVYAGALDTLAARLAEYHGLKERRP